MATRNDEGVDVDKVVVATGDDGDHVDTDRAHEEPMRVTRSVTMLNAAIEPASVKVRYLHLMGVSVSLLSCLTVWFSATAILPQLVTLWKLDPNLTPFLTATVQIGFAIGAFTLSVFSLPDRVPARILFLVGGITAAVFNVLITAWKVFPFVVVLRLLTGFSISLVYPPSMRIISTWFSKDRGLALGILIGAFCIGSAAPHLINGFQAARYWEIIIWVTSGLSLGGGILAYFVGEDGPFKLNKAKFKFKSVAKLYKDPGYLFPVLGYYGHMWEAYSSWGWIARYFNHVLTTAYPSDPVGNQVKASFVAFGLIAMGGVGGVLGGRIADRWGKPQLVILASSISALCSFIIGLLSFSPAASGVVAMIWGIAIAADSAQYSAMISEMTADRSLIGTALTLQTGSGFLISVISVFLVPLLSRYISWTWLFAILTPGSLFSIGCMAIILVRMQRKKTEEKAEKATEASAETSSLSKT